MSRISKKLNGNLSKLQEHTQREEDIIESNFNSLYEVSPLLLIELNTVIPLIYQRKFQGFP